MWYISRSHDVIIDIDIGRLVQTTQTSSKQTCSPAHTWFTASVDLSFH